MPTTTTPALSPKQIAFLAARVRSELTAATRERPAELDLNRGIKSRIEATIAASLTQALQQLPDAPDPQSGG